MSEHQAVSKIVRPLAIVALTAIVLALTLYGALSGYSASRSKQLNERWAAQFGTIEDVLERYPPRDSNATALELETLAATMGINLAPRALRTPVIDDDDAKAWNEIYRRILQRYVSAQLERDGGPVESPPPQLREWLDRYGPRLDAFTSHLTQAESPRWMLHLEDMSEAHIPNLLGHLQMQKLLVADALYRVHLGDPSRALERLDAAWTLNTSLADDPILITQLIALTGLQLQAATLRHVPIPAAHWQARLAAARPRARVLQSLEFEVWHWTQLDTPMNELTAGTLPRIASTVAAPYVRLCAVDATMRLRAELDRLKQLDYLCDRDLTRLDADLAVDLPAWNRLGGLTVPNLMGAVTRVAQAEIDLELTSRVIALRSARAATGRWPTALPDLSVSKACPSDEWHYAVDPDRGPFVALSREPSWPERRFAMVPTRFELSTR